MQLIIPDIHSAGYIFRVFRVIIEITLPINENNGPKNIISQNNSPYIFLELEDIDGKNYKIKATFTHTSVVDVILQSDNYFTVLFGIGNLRAKYPNITEEVWNMISRGKVRKGMTTDECRLALGNPIRIHIVTGGHETWSYERKTLDFTNKKLDHIN